MSTASRWTTLAPYRFVLFRGFQANTIGYHRSDSSVKTNLAKSEPDMMLSTLM